MKHELKTINTNVMKALTLTFLFIAACLSPMNSISAQRSVPVAQAAFTVVKVSKKGYFFKTYEGTLNLGSISAGDGIIMPTKIWDFSIQRNDEQQYQ